MSKMVANIEITSQEFIRPSSPTPHDTIDHKLSLLDQLQLPIYTPFLLFYQNPSISTIIDPSQRFQHLKQSLADALSKFNHLAGRINKNVSVYCNDSGALLLEAHVDAPLLQAIQNATIDELHQYLPFEPYAILKNDVTNGTDDKPLLGIQISFFACGGTAIGVCISHKIADAASLVTFVNYWATLSRAGDRMDDDDDLPVIPDRDLASQLFPPLEENFPSFQLPMDGPREKLVIKRFLFKKEKLSELKALASSDDDSFGLQVKDPTRVELISAFLWKQFIDISRAKGEAQTMFLAGHVVNMRTRMKSLSSAQNKVPNGNVFGNLIVNAPTISLSLGFSNRYQELLWMLRSGIRRINDDFIKFVQSGVPYLNCLYDSLRLLFTNQRGILSCYFSSWCGFPIYEVDYGWGKPIIACTLLLPYTKNTVVLMGTKCGDGIEAWINLSEDEIAMLPNELLSLETTQYL